MFGEYPAKIRGGFDWMDPLLPSEQSKDASDLRAGAWQLAPSMVFKCFWSLTRFSSSENRWDLIEKIGSPGLPGGLLRTDHPEIQMHVFRWGVQLLHLICNLPDGDRWCKRELILFPLIPKSTSFPWGFRLVSHYSNHYSFFNIDQSI